MSAKKKIFSSVFFAGLVFFLMTWSPGLKQENPSSAQKTGFQREENYAPFASPTTTPSIKSVKILSPTPSSFTTPRPTPTPPSTDGQTPSVETASVVTPTPSSLPSSDATKLQVDVSINNEAGFTLNVDEGTNQCEVLTQALSAGKINQLKMEYNNAYNSYAVYQINNLGKENQVWWIYKVNGQSPTQGCSYIKAKNGDQIEWQYLGN